MNKTSALTLLAICAGIAAAPAYAQRGKLEPPKNRYFTGKGSWGQGYPDQWALLRIGFDNSKNSAWRLVKRNAAPVTVAVIDTGLDWNHKNVDWENLWRNPKEIEGNGVDDDKNGFVDDVIGWDFFSRENKPWDYDGHGTFVAGIIAGSWKDKDGIAGVNPFARLMILKGISNVAKTRASYVAQAITYAADHGARVINLSLGGRGISTLETEAIDYAYAKGAVIVVAAGNEGINNVDFGFGGNAKVLTVGSTGLKDEHPNFSNWGAVSVAAPGIDILSLRARRTDVLLDVRDSRYEADKAFVGADKRHYRASGTSFSAPLVSGLASLMIANDPSLTNRQVMDIIMSTARDVGTPGVDQFTGYGVIDARAALKAPKNYRLLAGVKRVEVVAKNKTQFVRVRGIADANAFKGAQLEIGAGENPSKWRRIGTIGKAVTDANGVLGDIPAEAFAGPKVWQIRIVVTHGNGAKREARFKLTLG